MSDFLSMAIKMNMIQKDREDLTHALEKAGYKGQKRKFHCTVGFIKNMIPEEEAHVFGKVITQELHKFITPHGILYEVDRVLHLFDCVIVFSPTPASQKKLKETNAWLCEKILELSEGRWKLNQESLPKNYIPHLTVWHARRPDRRLKKLENYATTHPCYHLREADYVLLHQ